MCRRRRLFITVMASVGHVSLPGIGRTPTAGKAKQAGGQGKGKVAHFTGKNRIIERVPVSNVGRQDPGNRLRFWSPRPEKGKCDFCP